MRALLRSDLVPGTLLGLLALKAAWGLDSWALSLALAGLAALLLVSRKAPRAHAVFLGAALLVEAAFVISAVASSEVSRDSDQARRVAAVQARARQLEDGLGACAAAVAALPESSQALAGDSQALGRLFSSLVRTRDCEAGRPALAVRSQPLTPLAWAGRATDRGAIQATLGKGSGLLVSAGSLTTTFMAVAPVRNRDGILIGLATAERVVAERRNIQNEFLSDFDLLAEAAPETLVNYVKSEDADAPGPLQAGESLIHDRNGRAIAVVRADGGLPRRSPSPEEIRLEAYRGAAGLLLGCFLALIASTLVVQRAAPWAVVAICASRAALLLLPTRGAWIGRILPSGAYSSSLFGPLTASPLDLLLTAAAAFALACLLVVAATRASRATSAFPRVFLGDFLASVILVALFAVIGDTVRSSTLDVEIMSPWPSSLVHAVVDWSLLLELASGAALLLAVFLFTPSEELSPLEQAARLGAWSVFGLFGVRFWPTGWVGMPLIPAVALYLAAALLGATRGAWLSSLRRASPGGRAGIALVAVAMLALILYPALAHFSDKGIRAEVENVYSKAVLAQPERRSLVLSAAEAQIDAMRVLEEGGSGVGPAPLLDQLAFAIWSRTDLAALGLSSAVELQDASGALISRFALNLPAFSTELRTLPAAGPWTVSQDLSPLASSRRRVLHARHLLVYHGEVHGAIHVYVATDFWNLPFLSGRDPYSVLYRTGPPHRLHERAVSLFVVTWARDPIFTSTERPPAIDAEIIQRARGGAFWTTIPAEDGPERTFVFSDKDRQAVYGLGYPMRSAGRFAAELVEAVTGFTLAASALLLVLLLTRTFAGRTSLSLPSLILGVRERFSLRLFVTLIAVAVLPLLVLQTVVRDFVSRRLRREAESQALERATTARKIVEDYALLQRSEAADREPVTDAALVWVASVIGNDLDVFGGGRLLASSKRDLYASGLAAPRVDGRTYLAIVLDKRPLVVGTERIGGFSYRVASVPVHLEAGETGILSMPLALGERELQATLADLDRSIRLASILFLAAAAMLAQSMARRISGPVRDLTTAAQRIAKGDLEARVTTASRDEFLTLVEAFNQMAGDLTRQRADLQRSNRLAAWADMARQVAHEVKNPLTPIQLSTEHLRRLYADRSADFDEALHSCTETILQQVKKLREIVTEFSAFARPPAPEAEPLNVLALVRDVTQPYLRALPPGVLLEVHDPGEPSLSIRGDRRLLERAIVNLLENALHAVGDTGAVRVRLKEEREGGSPVAVIEVEDTGPGLDPEAKARAFEPFFSTKTGGSGLGLALVRKIAEEHGGGASLDGRPGSTLARIWLPSAGPS